MSNQIDLARQQIIGFRHAADGYDFVSLAETMGMTSEEWKELRDDPALTPQMIRDLDEHFNEAV